MIVVPVKKFNERFCVAVLRTLARRRCVLAGLLPDPDVAAFFRAEADALEQRAPPAWRWVRPCASRAPCRRRHARLLSSRLADRGWLNEAG